MTARTQLIKDCLVELRIDLTTGDLDAAQTRFAELIDELESGELDEEEED